MISKNNFIEIVLSFQEVVQLPHFQKISFRVNKKIFCTLDEDAKLAVIKISINDQSVFCSFAGGAMYPVEGKWGLQGWTVIDLSKAKIDMITDALKLSYVLIAPKRLAEKYNDI